MKIIIQGILRIILLFFSKIFEVMSSDFDQIWSVIENRLNAKHF